MDTKHKYEFIIDIANLSRKYEGIGTLEAKEYVAMLNHLMNTVTTPEPESKGTNV